MSDQSFDFGPPPPRREPRQFEPPPWEREQFERHKREQAERDAQEKLLAEQEAARAAEQPVAQGAEPEHATAGPMPGPASAPEVAAGSGQSPTAPSEAKRAVDEKEVALLMIGLRAEESPVLEGAWVVNVVAGAVVALVGLASSIWGVAAMARKGMPVAGTFGGLVLLTFGLGFLGLGGWLVFKALRQRGVL